MAPTMRAGPSTLGAGAFLDRERKRCFDESRYRAPCLVWCCWRHPPLARRRCRPSTRCRRRWTPPAGAVTVYEPHLSVGDAHTAVDYVGYPAVDVMARLFGADWSSEAETVEFRALDGYVSRLPVERFLTEGAFMVFARGDGAPFTVDNLAQNETDVPLGPYYLVWDNIGNPALLAEGARNWPYQVAEVNLVNLSDAALLPAGLDARFHEGAALAKTHCLSCHLVNGYGGEKYEGNLAEVTKDYEQAEFVSLILAPLSVLEETTMPPLSDRLPEGRTPAHRQGALRLPRGSAGAGVAGGTQSPSLHPVRWRR